MTQNEGGEKLIENRESYKPVTFWIEDCGELGMGGVKSDEEMKRFRSDLENKKIKFKDNNGLLYVADGEYDWNKWESYTVADEETKKKFLELYKRWSYLGNKNAASDAEINEYYEVAKTLRDIEKEARAIEFNL